VKSLEYSVNAFVDEKTLAAKMSTAALQQAVDRARLDQDARKKPEPKSELSAGARIVLELAGVDPSKDLSPWMVEQLNQGAAKHSMRLEQIPRSVGGGMMRRSDIAIEILEDIKDQQSGKATYEQQQEQQYLLEKAREKEKDERKAAAEETRVNIGLLAKAEAIFYSGMRKVTNAVKNFYEEYVPQGVKQFFSDAGDFVSEKWTDTKQWAVRNLPEPVVDAARGVRDFAMKGYNFVADKLGFGDEETPEQQKPNGRQMANQQQLRTQDPEQGEARGQLTERAKQQAAMLGKELAQQIGGTFKEANGLGPAIGGGLQQGQAGGRGF
jgi:hypothetical protein